MPRIQQRRPPRETPEIHPGGSSGDHPGEPPGDPPGDAPEDPPRDPPEEPPEDTPEDPPEDPPEEPPEGLPEDIPRESVERYVNYMRNIQKLELESERTKTTLPLQEFPIRLLEERHGLALFELLYLTWRYSSGRIELDFIRNTPLPRRN